MAERKEAEMKKKRNEEDSERVGSKPAVVRAEKRKGKKKDVVELDREYVVPLRKGAQNVPHYRRTKKAIRTLKEFMVRHMNVRDGDLRKVKVDINLNNEIWFRGIRNPIDKIKVRAVKREGIVTVSLVDVPDVVRFKMAREAKAKAKAMAGAEKGKDVKKEDKKNEGEIKSESGVAAETKEKEKKKAGAEMDAKVAKTGAKAEKHTASGKHEGKTAPVRKVMK